MIAITRTHTYTACCLCVASWTHSAPPTVYLRFISISSAFPERFAIASAAAAVAATRRSWIIKKKLLLLTQYTYEMQWTAPTSPPAPTPLLQTAPKLLLMMQVSKQLLSRSYLFIYPSIFIFPFIQVLVFESLSICPSIPIPIFLFLYLSLYLTLYLPRAQWQDNVLGAPSPWLSALGSQTANELSIFIN